MTFSAAFSGAFAGAGDDAGGAYLCPVLAGAAIAAGAAVSVASGQVRIGGALLIGTAGKVYQFASDAAAQKWCDVAAARLAFEPVALAGMGDAARVAWVAKKRLRMAEVARRVVAAAARQADAGKRAALIAEADFCLGKWR